MPSGREAAGTIVAINRGDGEPRTQLVGHDGQFRFEHLTPGAWEVRRTNQESIHPQNYGMVSSEGRPDRQIEPSCHVIEGETTYFDLDLRDWHPVVLAAELLINGEPARGWRISLWPSGERMVSGALPRGITDGNGRLKLEVDEARAWRITLGPAPESSSTFEAEFDEVELKGGESPWRKNLEVGRIEGRVKHGSAGPLRFRFKHSSGQDVSYKVTPDVEDHFVLPFVPPGPGVFERGAGAGKRLVWSRIAEAESVAGQTVLVELD
jgi:hypothetical protein